MSTIRQLSAANPPTPAATRAARFALLFALGLPGVLSLYFMPVSAEMLALTGLPEASLRAVIMVQPAILLAVAVFAGVATADQVGLRAPVVTAWLARRGGWPQLRPQLAPAVAGGVATAVAIVIYGALQARLGPGAAAEESAGLPLLTRVLYGGITEELLLRWGVMSFLLWLGWRVVQRRAGAPRPGLVWAVIVVAALLFGVGHLPAAAALGILTPVMGGLIVLFNAIGGVIFGWLFWRHGLEAAIVAHITAHLVTVLVLLPLAGPLLA